ncbi:SrfA family protein [Reyranella sp.]|jgi:hypothetical protein|uniref:SrfA family protein n=1 Tax=Reyranella sp. TaxID=1929291 RepID=UPI002F95E091
MAGPLLSSEPLQRYRALGLAGDPVWRAAGQLRAAIAQRLSREHADLLAVPEVDPSGRRIDWYAPFDGDARQLADLGEAERSAVLDKVRRLHADLARLAERMEAPERSGAERNFAKLLRHALTAPGEETLHVVSGKPVMTFWGFSADAALPGVFLASPPKPPMPASSVPDAVVASAPAAVLSPAMRSSWWQWLVLAAVLLLLLALLAWIVRPYLPHIEPQLEAEARDRALAMSVRQPLELQQARIGTLIKDNENLRLELARLTDEVAQRGGNCSTGVIGPGGVIVGSMNDSPIERRAEADARNGPDANVADKNKAKGPDDKGIGDKGAPDKTTNGADKDKQSAGRKDEPKPMVVPPDAKQKHDLAFLKGDWRSRTSLATPQGEKNLHPSYTLDDKGKGKVSFVQQDGSTCEAPAEARWDSGKLVIEEKSNPKCTDGRTYARNIVNCEIGQDGVAQCNGSQPGDKRSYSVQIGR